MKVFVYGTLKKNEPNHHWLTTPENGVANFVCKGRTVNLYPLVIASKYNIPFLLDRSGTGNSIQGEVYEIDEKMLSKLDILEEYPKLYIRREENIIPITESGEDVSKDDKTIAWTYFLSDFQPELLKRPYLSCYLSEGDHGLIYLASEDDLDDAKNVIQQEIQ